jgi:hypothetical protein
MAFKILEKTTYTTASQILNSTAVEDVFPGSLWAGEEKAET